MGFVSLPRKMERFDANTLIEAIGGASIWLHIDSDVVDPCYLPAEYKIEQGLRPSSLHALLRDIVRTSEIVGFELTEFEATIFGLFARSSHDRPGTRCLASKSSFRALSPQ